MRAQILSQSGALGLGADLWILPDRDHSRWTKKLDWYLNFMIAHLTNKLAKGFRQPAPALLEIAARHEVPLPTIKVSESAPVLISSAGMLPPNHLVLLPISALDESGIHQWINTIFKIAKNLRQPNCRIFLPTGINPTDVQFFCSTKEEADQATIVPDRDH